MAAETEMPNVPEFLRAYIDGMSAIRIQNIARPGALLTWGRRLCELTASLRHRPGFRTNFGVGFL